MIITCISHKGRTRSDAGKDTLPIKLLVDQSDGDGLPHILSPPLMPLSLPLLVFLLRRLGSSSSHTGNSFGGEIDSPYFTERQRVSITGGSGEGGLGSVEGHHGFEGDLVRSVVPNMGSFALLGIRFV